MEDTDKLPPGDCETQPSQDYVPGDGGSAARQTPPPTTGRRLWIVRMGMGLISAVAAGLAVWWRPRQETFFGLTVGIASGYMTFASFARISHRKKVVQRVLGMEWNEYLAEEPVCSAFLKNSAYWAREQDNETMHWFNNMIRIMWPYYNEAICNTVVSSLKPVLDQYRPSFISSIYFKSFTLGEIPFEVTNVRVVKELDGRPLEGELNFEKDFRWNGDINICLAVAALGTGKLCQVKLKNFVMVGKIRLLLRPHLPKIPCFGSVSVSFIEPPTLDFDLSLTGALALADPIEAWIKPLVQSFVQNSYVWPQRLVVPMFGEDVIPRKELEPRLRGILRVEVVGATGLAAMDYSGKSDPYLTAYTVPLRRWRSTTKYKSLDPVWEEESYFRIYEVSQYLYVELKDEDNNGTGDDFMGRARIGPLHEIPGLISQGEVVAGCYDLGWEDWSYHQDDGTRGPGKGAGKVHLRLEYMELSELRKKGHKGGSSIQGAGRKVQAGIVFCKLLRAVNVSTESIMAKVSAGRLPPFSTQFATATTVKPAEPPADSSEVAVAEGPKAETTAATAKATETGSVDAWRSQATWLAHFSFFDIKSAETLAIELYKSTTFGVKRIGFVDVPLALVANPSSGNEVQDIFELEGLPFKGGSAEAYAGAAVELSMEWVPLDGLPVPDLKSVLKGMGVLKVRLCHATGLPKMDLVGSTDPYVELQIGPKKRRRSEKKSNDRNPVWMEEFRFARVTMDQALLVKVWDEEIGKPTLIGDVSVPISAVIRKGNALSGIWKLQNARKGSICLDILWLPYDGNVKDFLRCAENKSGPRFLEEPVQNMVPPFAFDKQMWDVTVSLISAQLITPPGDVKSVYCVLMLKDQEQKSKVLDDVRSPTWNQTFNWKAIQGHDSLVVELLGGFPGASPAVVGTLDMELHKVVDAGGSVKEVRQLEGTQGSVKLSVTMTALEVEEEEGGAMSTPRSAAGGCLNVTLISAGDLVAKDIGGSSDPKCTLKLRDQTFRSSTQWKTLNPTWKEHFQFIDVHPDEVLEVYVEDYDRVGENEPLGHVHIPVMAVTDEEGQSLLRTWTLWDTKTGTISLKLSWLNNPESPLVPTLSQKSSSFSIDAETQLKELKGNLKLTLHGASNLPKSGMGAVDAYVKATVTRQPGVAYRSAVAKSGQNPKWEKESFTFTGVGPDDILTVRLADKLTIGKSVIGSALVPLRAACNASGSETLRKSWPVCTESGSPAGAVDLTLQFVPAD